MPIQLKWNYDDVAEWIENLGFPQYRKTFELNMINGRNLILLDANALVRMNIKDYNDIKTITKSIRDMYRMELPKCDKKCISIPLKYSPAHFKAYKVLSLEHRQYKVCDLFKEVPIVKETSKKVNHFERLHQKLKHIPNFQSIRIGRIIPAYQN